MTKINSKNKGSTFERRIANRLSEQFSEHLQMEKGFRRNPDSGSFFGGSNKQRVGTHDTSMATFGDLICPVSFLFSIECKHYKTPPSMGVLFSGEIKQWDGWLAQVTQDSSQTGKAPLLIIKYNNVPEIVLVTKHHEGIPCRFKYKDMFVYTLDDLLTLPLTEFFA
jgi:hypothetical protein